MKQIKVPFLVWMTIMSGRDVDEKTLAERTRVVASAGTSWQSLINARHKMLTGKGTLGPGLHLRLASATKGERHRILPPEV